jgi:hypothetical protein
MGDVRIAMHGGSVYSLAHDLRAAVDTPFADRIVYPHDTEQGFAVTPEIATIIVSAVSNIVLLVNAVIGHLEKHSDSFTIKIASSSGETLELTSRASEEKRNEFIELVKDRVVQHIELDLEEPGRPRQHQRGAATIERPGLE